MNDLERNILLIDEQMDEMLYSALVEGGGKVSACQSLSKAWDFIYPVPPHFVVVHLRHPNPEDVTILQECRAMAKGVPIVVATTHEQTEILKTILEDRPAAFLVLPAGPHDVSRVFSEIEQSTNQQ
jgi:DNA-binding NtrC family response regulator